MHGPATVRHALQPNRGVPAGIVLARLGADVVLTDLAPNLPLLRDNCKANGMLWLSLNSCHVESNTHTCTHTYTDTHIHCYGEYMVNALLWKDGRLDTA